MTARELLDELRQAGLSISLTAEGLRVDGPAAIREVFRERIRAHKQELIDAIRKEEWERDEYQRRMSLARLKEVVRERLQRNRPEGKRSTNGVAICPCGSTEYVDHPIHGGQSLRRDCARCGRFIGFPLWYGVQRAIAGPESAPRGPGKRLQGK